MRGNTQGPRQVQKSGGERPASGHQQSQGPNTQLKAFIGKRKLTENWPPISSLPEAARASSTKSRKEGATKLGPHQVQV